MCSDHFILLEGKIDMSVVAVIFEDEVFRQCQSDKYKPKLKAQAGES
jgi:hypothetical protein